MSRKSPTIDIASTRRYNSLIPMGLPAGSPYCKRQPGCAGRELRPAQLPHNHSYASQACLVLRFNIFRIGGNYD